MYRCIKATEDEAQDTRFEDGMSDLKDDFNYMMDSFDKMSREGRKDKALSLIEYASNAVNEAIAQSAKEFTSNEE